MSFIKKERDFDEYSKEIEYLRKIGYKNPLGFEIGKYVGWLTVDEENDSFLILTGATDPNRDNVRLTYYVLCVKGIPITLTLKEEFSGNAYDKSIEFLWRILKIECPDEHNIAEFKNLKDTITEAFNVESYTEVFTHERVKKIEVRFEIKKALKNQSFS